jgi:polyhydroxyalkanoate synthesis regulator phasin|tara:strand:- start:442 stop:909 length:468 start_codon:yes stop_codon:yes gene_type:complete
MENGLSDLLALLLCWGFFILFIGCGIAGFLARSRPIELPQMVSDLIHDDKIQIGYIDDVQPVNIQTVEVNPVNDDELHQLKKQVELLKLRKQLQQLKNECSPSVTNVTKNLMQECIDSLVSLGEKRTSAKSKVKDIFNNYPDLKTVDEFIKRVFQ